MTMRTKANQKADEKRTSKAFFNSGENGNTSDFKSVAVPVAFSLFFHVAFFILLIFTPKSSFEKSYVPTVVDVHMVSPGELRTEVRTDEGPSVELKKETPKKAPERPETEPEPEVSTAIPEPKKEVSDTEQKSAANEIEKPSQPEPKVSLAPKKAPRKKVKKSLKKRTFQPSKVVRSAIKRLEEKAETSRPKTVADAIEALRKDVRQKPSNAGKDKKSAAAKESTASAGTSGGTGISGGKGLKSWEVFDIYKVEIAYRIQRNWAFSEQLTRGRDNLETLVGIKILPNGEVNDIWFDKKSGNHYLDESAIRAIKKSSPLPPLPKDFTGRYYQVGLRFTPKGITR